MPLTPEEKKAIFDPIKSVMLKYSPPMVISKNEPHVFEMIGNKEVPYGYRKEIVPGMYFASIVIRKDMISFYFFPIYFHTKDFIGLIPSMEKYLKGKTCFNFKKAEQVNVKELDALLKKGTVAWLKNGFMK
jgi:hypothetical protein